MTERVGQARRRIFKASKQTAGEIESTGGGSERVSERERLSERLNERARQREREREHRETLTWVSRVWGCIPKQSSGQI